jgi:hypothetical protein
MKLESNPPEPMREQAIRQRAYELYVQRGKLTATLSLTG